MINNLYQTVKSMTRWRTVTLKIDALPLQPRHGPRRRTTRDFAAVINKTGPQPLLTRR